MNKRYPSSGYTKDQLRELALAGVREKVREMEQELARIHHEFPGLLLSETPVVLLPAEARTNGRGTWPIQPAPSKPIPNKTYSSATRKQRMQSAKLLATLSTTEPRRLGRHAGSLIRHGYIRSVGKDPQRKTLFLRTDKPFTV